VDQISVTSLLNLPSSSFLEYAFLRWVLSIGVHSDAASLIRAQHPVAVGEHSYRLDYAILGENRRIAVELDGWSFHSSRDAFSYDRMRQNDLQAEGWSVIRFSYDSIRSETERCVFQLGALLRTDSFLSKFVLPNPVIETPEMNPDAIWSLAPSPSRQPQTVLENSYFDKVRAHLRLATLRECQQQAFFALSNYYANGGKSAACIMAVGAGKTALGVTACLGFAKRRALVVTPGNVIRGTFDRAFDPEVVGNALYGLPGGPLLPGLSAPRVLTLDRSTTSPSQISRSQLLQADVIVTNFHSLGTTDEEGSLLSKLSPLDIDLVIVDEAHIAAANSYKRTFAHFNEAKTLLMSACFQRLDGKPIEADVVYRYRLIDSIADGVAKNLRIGRFEPSGEETIYEIVHSNGAREEIVGRQALLQVIQDERKLARITARSDTSIRVMMQAAKSALERQSKELHPIKPRALFAAIGQKHAEQITRVANECGIPCAMLHHSMTEARVRETLRRFESDAGDLQAIVQLKMLGQGYDFPPVCVVVPMRPYGSFSEFYQFIGRGIRVLSPKRLSNPDVSQMLDVLYHAELGLDDHLDTLHQENDLSPLSHGVEEHENEPLEKNGTDSGSHLREPSPEAWVLWEQGTVEQRIIHDQERVERHRDERERDALAQRYVAYAQKTTSPVSFDEFLNIMRRFGQ
jgi:superfamily II DNA or RNA helicase/very-short-patch-repair endonuclease